MRLIVFLLSLCFLSPLLACNCTDPGVISKNQAEAFEIIFEGTVDSVSSCRDGKAYVWFSVKDVFRGHTFSSWPMEFDCTSDCFSGFSKGQTWLVYGNGGTRYQTGFIPACSRTRLKPENSQPDFGLVAAGGMKYETELDFLVKNFGTHAPSQKNEADNLPKNIIPRGYTPLWWLIGSFGALLVLYLVVRRFWKF